MVRRRSPAEHDRWLISTLYTAFHQGWLGLRRAGILDDPSEVYSDDDSFFPLRINPAKRRELELLAARADNAAMRRATVDDAQTYSYAALLLSAEALSSAADVAEAAYYASKIQEHRTDLGLLRSYESINPAAWLDGRAKDAFWSEIQRERRALRGNAGRLPAGPELEAERAEIMRTMNPDASQKQRQAAAHKQLAGKYNVTPGAVVQAINRWRQRDTTG